MMLLIKTLRRWINPIDIAARSIEENVYIDASAADVGDGTQRMPYKTLSQFARSSVEKCKYCGEGRESGRFMTHVRHSSWHVICKKTVDMLLDVVV